MPLKIAMIPQRGRAREEEKYREELQISQKMMNQMPIEAFLWVISFFLFYVFILFFSQSFSLLEYNLMNFSRSVKSSMLRKGCTSI